MNGAHLSEIFTVHGMDKADIVAYLRREKLGHVGKELVNRSDAILHCLAHVVKVIVHGLDEFGKYGE